MIGVCYFAEMGNFFLGIHYYEWSLTVYASINIVSIKSWLALIGQVNGALLNPLILARPPAHCDRTRPWDRVRTLFVAGDPFPFVYTIQIPTVTAVTATPTVTATVAVAVAVAVTATATMAVAVAVLTVTVSLTLAGIDAQLMLQRIIFFYENENKTPDLRDVLIKHLRGYS